MTGPVIRVNTPLGTLPQTNRVWFTTNFCCFAETTVTHLFAHLEKEETKMFSIDHPTHSILANFWNLTLDRPSMGAPEKSARGRQQIQLREQCAAGRPTPSLQDRLWPKDKPLSLTQTPFCPVPIVRDSIKMALFLLLSFARAFIPDLPISKDGTRVHEKDFSRFFFLLENIQKTFEVCLFGPPKRISGFQKTQNTWGPDLFIRFNSLSWVIYVLPLPNYFERQKVKLKTRSNIRYASSAASDFSQAFFSLKRTLPFYILRIFKCFLWIVFDRLPHIVRRLSSMIISWWYDDSNLWLENSSGCSWSGDLS